MSGQFAIIGSEMTKEVRNVKVKGKERLFAIYEYLLEHKSAKVAELAEIFGVSERTILRDVQSLSCYYYVYTDSTRGHSGVFLDDTMGMAEKYKGWSKKTE